MQFVHSQNDTPRETRIVVIDSVYAVDTISLLDVQNKQFIEVSWPTWNTDKIEEFESM